MGAGPAMDMEAYRLAQLTYQIEQQRAQDNAHINSQGNVDRQ
jgi:hypothetical protein